jgi:hypothetical protein
MKKALIFLLLFSLLAAEDTDLVCNFEPEDEAGQEAFASAMGLVVGAIMLSVIIVSLAYMFGKATSNADLLVFSKDELFHLIMTVLIFISIIGIFEGSCHFFGSFLGTEGPLTVSKMYSESLLVKGKALLTGLIKSSVNEKFQGATLVGYMMPLLGGEMAFKTSYHTANERQYEILSDVVTAGYVSAGIQFYIIYFLQSFVFPVLLPFGLLLRALPFVREAGNAVLAIVFSLLVILPLAYAINASALYVPLDYCDSDEERVLQDCDSLFGWGGISSYLFQTVFLPNLAMVVFITAATAMMKVAKVIP